MKNKKDPGLCFNNGCYFISVRVRIIIRNTNAAIADIT